MSMTNGMNTLNDMMACMGDECDENDIGRERMIFSGILIRVIQKKYFLLLSIGPF